MGGAYFEVGILAREESYEDGMGIGEEVGVDEIWQKLGCLWKLRVWGLFQETVGSRLRGKDVETFSRKHWNLRWPGNCR